MKLITVIILGLLSSGALGNDIKIIPIPGASAVSTAVSISGFSEKFFFNGFLPDKNQAIMNDLKKLSELDQSVVFFVSAKKINRIIPELKNYFSGRKILFCR